MPTSGARRAPSRKMAAEAKKSPTMPGELQPQPSPSVSAIISEISAAPSSRAPGRRRVPHANRRFRHVAADQHDRDGHRDEAEEEQVPPDEVVDDDPREHDPKPPPTPKTADIRPIPTFTLSGGNSSRMIANDSGKSAAPRPRRPGRRSATRCSTRSRRRGSRGRRGDRLTCRIRALPYWSPSRPRIGVHDRAGDEEGRDDPGRPRRRRAELPWKVESDGNTIVCWSENAAPASVRIASVRFGLARSRSTPREASARVARKVRSRVSRLYVMRCGSSASGPRVSFIHASYSS